MENVIDFQVGKKKLITKKKQEVRECLIENIGEGLIGVNKVFTPVSQGIETTTVKENTVRYLEHVYRVNRVGNTFLEELCVLIEYIWLFYDQNVNIRYEKYLCDHGTLRLISCAVGMNQNTITDDGFEECSKIIKQRLIDMNLNAQTISIIYGVNEEFIQILIGDRGVQMKPSDGDTIRVIPLIAKRGEDD